MMSRTQGALCYMLGAVFGPLPVALVLLTSRDLFTRRCAVQALFGGVLLALGGALSLVVIAGGVAVEVTIHGVRSFNDSPTPPPIVLAAALIAASLIAALYIVQIVIAGRSAYRATKGTITIFPWLGARFDRTEP